MPGAIGTREAIDLLEHAFARDAAGRAVGLRGWGEPSLKRPASAGGA